MSATVVVRDESTAGHRSDGIELTFPSERITVRELIRERVYQEVQDFNRVADGCVFRGLVQPTESEAALNGYRVRKGKPIDWNEQFTKACDAFTSSRVLVIVGESQARSLDETIELRRGVEVTFLKLVPLVGG
jgi:hypothetical protein